MNKLVLLLAISPLALACSATASPTCDDWEARNMTGATVHDDWEAPAAPAAATDDWETRGAQPCQATGNPPTSAPTTH